MNTQILTEHSAGVTPCGDTAGGGADVGGSTLRDGADASNDTACRSTAPQNTAARIDWLDIIKCIAMYFVVIGHACKTSTPDSYRYYIYSFHMPLFFMLSGAAWFLQTHKGRTGAAPRFRALSDVVKNKARALLWPYLTLNILAILPWLVNYRILSHKDQTFADMLWGIVYSNEEVVQSPTNATWFILTLFLTTIVFFLIERWAKNNDGVLAAIILGIGAYGYAMSLREDRIDAPWHIETVPIALVLFFIGFMTMKYLPSFLQLLGGWKRQLLWFAGALTVGLLCARYNVKISMATNVYGSFLLFMGSVLGCSLACFLIAQWLPRLSILKFIGRNTLTILAFHAPVYRFMEVCSETTSTILEQHPVLTGTVVFLLMLPAAWIFERWLPFLLGKKAKTK